MSTQTNNWAGAIIRSLRSDAKKTGSLAVLLVILGVMVSRQLGGGRSGHPASASAASSASKTEPGLSTSAATSQSRAAAAQALLGWTRQPVQPVSRNLFAVQIEYFPLDGSRTTQTAMGIEGFWSSLEKSLTLRTDERVREENRIASFKKDAAKLQLQSTLPEAQKAMMNGQLVGEGSVVADFRVVKIEPRKVTVERDGIKLTIEMK